MPGIGENPALPAAAAAIPPVAAIQAAEATGNALFGHFQNVKNRKFAREQYKTQRQDALSDWATVNEYNSPRAQMQRYRDAGLNPNLIYGQMQTAQGVRSSSQSSASGTAPNTGGGIASGIRQQYDLRKKQADTDLQTANLELMNWTKKEMESRTYANYKSAGLSEAETNNKMYDLQFKKDTRDISINTMQAGLDKTIADTIATIHQDIRQEQLQPGNLTHQQNTIKRQMLDYTGQELQNAKTTAETDNLKTTLQILKHDEVIKALDAKIAASGRRPGDTAVQQFLKEVYDGINVTDVIKDPNAKAGAKAALDVIKRLSIPGASIFK